MSCITRFTACVLWHSWAVAQEGLQMRVKHFLEVLDELSRLQIECVKAST